MKLPTTWRTSNKGILNIVDMDTSHIENCIGMINRSLEKIGDIDEIYLPDFQGEMASYYAESLVNDQVRLIGMKNKFKRDLQAFKNELNNRKKSA